MSRSFSGANDTLRYAGAVVDCTATEVTNITFAVAVKRGRTSHSSDEVLMHCGPSANSNHLIGLEINATTNTVDATIRTSSGATSTSVATLADTTTWHLVVGKWVSGVPYISIDGGAFTTSGASRDPTTATSLLSLGGNLSATPGGDYLGLLAHPTFWGTALSDTDVSNLWNGGSFVDFETIQSGSLIQHCPLTRNESPEVDDIGAFDLTVSGATYSSDEPYSSGSTDTPLVVDAAQAVGEGSNVVLSSPVSVTLPVVSGSMVTEGQEVQFQLSSPYTEGQATAQGYDIVLTNFSGGVTSGSATGEGSVIAFPFVLLVTHAQGVGEGSIIGTQASIIITSPGGRRRDGRRRNIGFGRFGRG